jgi:hypothetical protein
MYIVSTAENPRGDTEKNFVALTQVLNLTGLNLI